MKTIRERLDPTLQSAITERDKLARKAKLTGYMLNIAIGLQVMLGALITALAATKSVCASDILPRLSQNRLKGI